MTKLNRYSKENDKINNNITKIKLTLKEYCCALRRNSINTPINKINALTPSKSQIYMHEHKIQREKARSKLFNEVRQFVYIFGAQGRRVLFKLLIYKGYKLIQRSKLRIYVICRRILSNELPYNSQYNST